eukprot:gene11056-biopygen286
MLTVTSRILVRVPRGFGQASPQNYVFERVCGWNACYRLLSFEACLILSPTPRTHSNDKRWRLHAMGACISGQTRIHAGGACIRGVPKSRQGASECGRRGGLWESTTSADRTLKKRRTRARGWTTPSSQSVSFCAPGARVRMGPNKDPCEGSTSLWCGWCSWVFRAKQPRSESTRSRQPGALPAPHAELRWFFEMLGNILRAGGPIAVSGKGLARHGCQQIGNRSHPPVGCCRRASGTPPGGAGRGSKGSCGRQLRTALAAEWHIVPCCTRVQCAAFVV